MQKEKHFGACIEEYIKRLGKSIQIHKIVPKMIGNHQQIIDHDTDRIIQTTKKISHTQIIVLEKSGKQIGSDMFAQQYIADGKDIIFCIGGPFGLDITKFEKTVQYVSFGQHTMPHALALVVLLEQIYRSGCIISGKKYHY